MLVYYEKLRDTHIVFISILIRIVDSISACHTENHRDRLSDVGITNVHPFIYQSYLCHHDT